VPRRLAPVAVLLVLLGACVSVKVGKDNEASGGSNAGERTFSNAAYPFTFQYPEGFRIAEITSVAATAGGGASDRVAIALNEDNAIFLARSEAEDINITEANIRDAVPEVDQVVSELISAPARGRVQEVGGYPSVVYDEVAVATPPNGQSRMVFLFDGKRQYFINCQSTPDRRAEVGEACDLAVSTLKKRS
jgi:hypothetical protein